MVSLAFDLAANILHLHVCKGELLLIDCDHIYLS